MWRLADRSDMTDGTERKMSGACEQNAAGSLFKVHGHGCVNPGSAAAPAAPLELLLGLAAARKAGPGPPCRGGLVLPSPDEQSPGVTSHLPEARVEGERSRPRKWHGQLWAREGQPGEWG